MNCPFCSILEHDLVYETKNIIAIRDRYPVSLGHTLVITKEHLPTYFDAHHLHEELWAVVDNLKEQLEVQYRPDGFNIGINCGKAAGQTVDHMHIHLIPRYLGDIGDPRGGVRGVIPHKQKY